VGSNETAVLTVNDVILEWCNESNIQTPKIAVIAWCCHKYIGH